MLVKTRTVPGTAHRAKRRN